MFSRTTEPVGHMLIITRYISRELVHMVMKIKEPHGLTRSLTHKLEHIGPSAYLMLTCVVEVFIQSSDTAAKVFQQGLHRDTWRV